MKRTVILAALTGILATVSFGANANTLSSAELRKVVTGKTFFLRAQGVELPIAYRSNGTMSGSLQVFTASLAPGTTMSDSGKWWIANNQLCQKWNRWQGSKSYCYKLSLNGTQVRWQRNDGRRGTARISG